MYQKVNANRNFPASEKKVEQFWKDNRIFEKSVEQRQGAPLYMFYEGLPPPTGSPTSATSSPG